MQSITKQALKRRMDLHDLWLPGGLLHKHIHSTEPPRLNTDVLRLVKQEIKKLPLLSPLSDNVSKGDCTHMKNTGSPPSEFPVDDGCRFASMSTPPSLRSSVEVEVEVEGDEFDGADGGGSNIVMSRGVSEKAGVNEGSLSSLPMLSSVQGNSPGDESLRVSGSTTGSGISECLYDPMDPGVISASISELEKNQRLSDSTIALVSKLIASQVPGSDSHFKILDPLWLQVDAGVTSRDFPFKAKAVPQQVLVPLHHLRPEHWTLAHVNFITQRVRYFDSL